MITIRVDLDDIEIANGKLKGLYDSISKKHDNLIKTSTTINQNDTAFNRDVFESISQSIKLSQKEVLLLEDELTKNLTTFCDNFEQVDKAVKTMVGIKETI